MRIFTPCWGRKHLNLLEKALGTSFLWPGNHQLVREANWTFLTHGFDKKKIIEIASKIIPENQIDFIPFHGSPYDLTAKREFVMLDALYIMMERCIKENRPMLIATPDFIFGDYSIRNMALIGDQDGVCVSMPHPRVLPCTLNEITERPMSNAELISLAFKHPHKSWTLCEAGLKESGTYIGGIYWKKMSEKLVSVQHRMPSPYYVNFKPQDIHFFKTPTGRRLSAFGAWDHDWPELLINEGRQRLIGSSDIATLIEVTDADLNVPPITIGKEADKFQHSELHYRINRQFISSFRGE